MAGEVVLKVTVLFISDFVSSYLTGENPSSLFFCRLIPDHAIFILIVLKSEFLFSSCFIIMYLKLGLAFLCSLDIVMVAPPF